MLTLKGKENSANVMIDSLDEETMSQIHYFLNHPALRGTYIAIMPDCHAGAGAVIGFTAKLNDYVIPNVVGVDIGCGVYAYKLEGIDQIVFADLDKFIRANIPSGFHKRKEPIKEFVSLDYVPELKTVVQKTEQNITDVLRSLATLGGGNHFIEVDVDNDGNFWLLIHSGSRNFGLQVAKYHQNKAKTLMNQMFVGSDAYKGLEYLPLKLGGNEYLKDMSVAQQYAHVNRVEIASLILRGFFGLNLTVPTIESVHNYIHFKDSIIRKGAISARDGEKLVIPLNMRDGTIFGTGKGSSKWNYSAPHGAGRVLSRTKAKASLDLQDFTTSMEGVWTSCISKGTIDESPMAYKDPQTIIDAISETVDVNFVAKPVYNFKAS